MAVDFLLVNNVSTKNQLAFGELYSTTTLLIYSTNYWYEKGPFKKYVRSGGEGGGYLKSVRQRTRGRGYFKERTYAHAIFKCCLFEKHLK